ncbi:hypothetical protein KC335_g180 [Hortaea werneckii]|nr:hypothetical protein KC335_g180 [Hortaea werneckii]
MLAMLSVAIQPNCFFNYLSLGRMSSIVSCLVRVLNLCPRQLSHCLIYLAIIVVLNIFGILPVYLASILVNFKQYFRVLLFTFYRILDIELVLSDFKGSYILCRKSYSSVPLALFSLSSTLLGVSYYYIPK